MVGAWEDLDGDCADVFGVDEGLALVCEWYDELAGQHRRDIGQGWPPVSGRDPSKTTSPWREAARAVTPRSLSRRVTRRGRAGGTENQNSHRSTATDSTDNPGTTAVAEASYRPSNREEIPRE